MLELQGFVLKIIIFPLLQMFEENPGLDACKSIAYVVPTSNVASAME